MTLLQNVLTQLSSPQVAQAISKKTKADTNQTQSILEQALPVLLSGMAKQAQNKSGAKSLLSALDKDHDGSILDDLAELSNHPQAAKGKAILAHVLGDKVAGLEDLLGQKTGVDKSTVDQVLKLAAPLLLGALGKEKSINKLNVKDLKTSLAEAKKEIGENDASSLLSFLDQDGDGNIKNDLLRMGMDKLKKKFFG